jgi:hypothetical protein
MPLPMETRDTENLTARSMPISGSTPRPLKIPRMSVAPAAEDKGHRVNNGKKATELFPKDEAVQDDEHRVPDGMCAKIDAHDATAFVRRALCVRPMGRSCGSTRAVVRQTAHFLGGRRDF